MGNYKIIIFGHFILRLFFILSTVVHSQIIKDDFLVNSPIENTKGVGKTSIAVSVNGNIGVAWHDYNDYNIPVAEQPRIASRLLNSNGEAIGSLNLFRGESRGTSIWTSDYVKENLDISFTHDGALFIAMEHVGEESFLNINSFTSEIGLGAVSPEGEIIDIGNHPGFVLWLDQTDTDREELPRITTLPNGEFYIAYSGLVKSTKKYAVIIQGFNADASFRDSPFVPHAESSADVNFRNADIAANGNISIAVWQDGRDDDNWDIYGQFFSSTNTIGNNFRINKNDMAGTVNILPSVVMNTSGESIVTWLDTRTNNYGDIYCQRFNSSGQTMGDNILVTDGTGFIVDRPEVSVLENGNFMVVWTDSIFAIGGDGAYRARGRQFNKDGKPLNEPFIIPSENVGSGYVDVTTDGDNYFCSWLDNRLGKDYSDVYVKVIGTIVTSISENKNNLPVEYSLSQNYPNPFNPNTTIKYSIKLPPLAKGRAGVGSLVTLKVYDVLGKEVAILINQNQKPGNYQILFDASGLTSGTYFYRLAIHSNKLQVSDFVESKKMLLMK